MGVGWEGEEQRHKGKRMGSRGLAAAWGRGGGVSGSGKDLGWAFPSDLPP